MDTLSETADKVDQSLQNMGIDGTSVKQSIRDFLNFKEPDLLPLRQMLDI